MNALIVLLVIIFLVVVVIWLLRRDRKPARQRKSAPRMAGDIGADTPTKLGGLEKLENNPLFWGVEIAHAGCEQAQALLGRQYTFDEAPQLPLEGCSSAMCMCQFKGLKDHRTQHRRKTGERRVEVRFDNDKPDRRSRKDRRRGNKWNDRSY